jgi:PAS domain S-box-containing protein
MLKEKTVAMILASRRGLVAVISCLIAATTGWLAAAAGGRRLQAFFAQHGLGPYASAIDDVVAATLAAVFVFLLLGLVRKREERIQDLHAGKDSVEELNQTLRSTIAAHESAEQRLRVSEDRFLLATLATQDTIWEWEVATNRVWMNDNRFGHQCELPVTHEWWLGLIHPEDRARIADSYQAAIASGGQFWADEYRILHGNGGYLFVRDRACIVRDEAGRPLRVTGAMSDITDLKRAEEASLRAREDWERTFDAVPDLIAIIDTEHRIVRANKAMASRMAKSQERCVGLKCHSIVHGLNEPLSTCPLSKLLQDGCEHAAEVHEDRLAGHFFITTSPLCDRKGRLIGCVHVARDITESKQKEEALRSSEARFRALFDCSRDAVQLLDRHGEYLDCNQATLELFGLDSKEQFVSRLAGECSTPTQPDGRDSHMAAKEKVEAALREGSQFFEWRLQRAGGEEFTAELLLSRGHLNGEAVLQCVMRDITERKQAEQKLRESEAELKAAQRSAHMGSWRREVEADGVTSSNVATWSEEYYRIAGRAYPGRAAADVDPGKLDPTPDRHPEGQGWRSAGTGPGAGSSRRHNQVDHWPS